jgi:hypothetical protein
LISLFFDTGDAMLVPKGWIGNWETDGTLEFSVIYDPEQLLPEKSSCCRASTDPFAPPAGLSIVRLAL